MKLKYIAIVLCLGIVAAACGEKDAVVAPDFNVTGYEVTAITDSAGNAVNQVTFSFSGDAQIISFYSGVLGNDYDYREGRTLDINAILSSFSTTLNNGAQEDQLSVLVSSDFNGTYDIGNIRAATWTDITGRFTLNTRNASASLPSGTKDIKDLHVEGKPFYYAFRYVCKPQSEFGANSTWRIRAFSLESQTDLGNASLATLTNADWHLVNEGSIVDPNRGAVIESSGAIRFNGNHLNKEVETESWAISKGFELTKTDMGPDRPIAIKSVINPRLTTYAFNYTTAGTYKVAFVASNTSYEGHSGVVREIEVKIP
ncbi:DUF5017 domain-containing protein [Chitinophaga sp. GCM10012297]|uniref:DUF5017 domain-containing protein n=1 Tax=Chitinophaga chungangae TaxID=2821488 RepID=A0ABS3YA30_9BACT|nr:DUF5017 domain-containing protein [Chitinophaga chungangae]MBO9151533.1 DUF5017 domain-containing protein [Chitinophaga chungangae]